MKISISRIAHKCNVLGPGTRVVVWVQGCSLGCLGCISPHTHDADNGITWNVDDLANHICEHSDSDVVGLTVSGGEPFEQARAVGCLISSLGTLKNWNYMVYSGHRLEYLQSEGTTDQRNLLEKIDILVDGRFRQNEQAPLKWRGSRNQRVHVLNKRMTLPQNTLDEEGAWIETRIDADGSLDIVGIPPKNFVENLLGKVKEQGIYFSS